MGIFGGPLEIGTFRSHHTLGETQRLILAALADHLTHEEVLVRAPGLVDAIYLSGWDSFRIQLTAGNSTRDLWNFIVEFVPEAGFIDGHAYFDRKRFDKWVATARQVTFDVPAMLAEASVKPRKWKSLYS